MSNNIWKECLSNFKESIGGDEFEKFFGCEGSITAEYDADNYVLTISAQPLLYGLLEKKFNKDIVQSLREVTKNEKSCVNLKRQNANSQSVTKPKENLKTAATKEKTLYQTQFNENYTFANFVKGSCNQVAVAAASAIAENPGLTPFNPFFVYGGSGLGKTHLAQAIAHEIHNRKPSNKVVFCPATEFMRQYVQVSEEKKINNFLAFYQSLDVLIIDDLQELISGTGTKSKLFEILKYLSERNKQIVFTADRSPAQLQDVFEDRFISRFKSGLEIELKMPEYETRLEILKRYAVVNNFRINDEIIDYIANRAISSVRDLHGYLSKLYAFSIATRLPISLETARQALQDTAPRAKKKIQIQDILEAVSEYFHIETDLILGKTRKSEIVQARQIAMWLAKNLTQNSLESIGMQIGNKNHSTVLHACKNIDAMRKTDKHLNRRIEEIHAAIMSPLRS